MYASKSAALIRPVAWRMRADPSLVCRYAAWTIEELRQLACQLQLANAGAKTRRELLELLAGHPGD
jgi:hypothetical protein